MSFAKDFLRFHQFSIVKNQRQGYNYFVELEGGAAKLGVHDSALSPEHPSRRWTITICGGGLMPESRLCGDDSGVLLRNRLMA